jgi:hypothetical protein
MGYWSSPLSVRYKFDENSFKSSVLWDIMPFSLVKFCRRFVGTVFLHAGFMLSLLFDPEDRGDRFFREVSRRLVGLNFVMPQKTELVIATAVRT